MIAGDLDLVFGLVRFSQIQLEVGCVSSLNHFHHLDLKLISPKVLARAEN